MRPDKINASRTRAVLTIHWSSDRSCELTFADLRAACPCAECRGTHSATVQQPVSDGLELMLRSDQATVLDSIKAVGNYAIQVFWQDGHTHGIYSWDYLQDLCNKKVHPGNGASN